MNLKKIKKYLKRPRNIIYYCLCHNPHLIKNDELYLRMLFSLRHGRSLDLSNPSTFSEKLQWLKLYNRRPEYTIMVDKYAVKEYVACLIGKEHIIQTLAVYNSVNEIDWDKLPNRFVLKTTHDSGGIVICLDRSTFDRSEAIKKLHYALVHDNYSKTREWPYKNVPRRIIAEEYIEQSSESKDLPDYKFFCFDGKVKALFVATERQNPNEEVKFDFFDADFNPLPLRQGHNHAKVLPQKPQKFEEMKRIAEILSHGIPHIRVDLYEVDNKVLFGELTFFHFGGFTPFEPQEWDRTFGNFLNLPLEMTK